MRSDKRISFIPPLHSVRLQAEYSEATIFGTMIALRFMSNLCLAVEKVTESPTKSITLILSLGLAASGKTQRRGLSSPTNLFSFPSIGAAPCTSVSEDLCCPIEVQGSFLWWYGRQLSPL